MSYEPLHHKYRPQSFADLVGQQAITTTLSNAIISQRIAPAYLFTGPRGTGKTSSARILAKSLNCLSSDFPTINPCGQCEVCLGINNGSALDVIEIDAASNTGVDNIREIIERAQFAPVQCRYKLYAIDECHMLSSAAFNALLKTLEEPPNRVVFVLATTDPQRVLPTIISRCQRFDYRRIPLTAMIEHLGFIALKENINIEQEALTLVAQFANGGLRDAESLLDQLSLFSGTISAQQVWELVGVVSEQDLFSLLQAIKQDLPQIVIEQCRNLLDLGKEPLVVLQNLASFYINLLLAKTSPQRPDLVALTNATWQQLCQEALSWDMQLILQGQQKLREAEVQIKNTTQPRLWLEVTLLELLPSARLIAQPSPVTTSESTVINPSLEYKRPNLTIVKSPSTPTEITALETKKNSESTINRNTELEKSENQITKTEYEDVSKLWQQVLAKMQPRTTQALVSQHCQLIIFDGVTASVGVTSPQLHTLAQQKISNIEKAFELVCQHKVKVVFQIISHNTPLKLVPDPKSREIPPSSLPNVKVEKINDYRQLDEQPQEQNINSIPAIFNSPLEEENEDEDIEKAAANLVKIFQGTPISHENLDELETTETPTISLNLEENHGLEDEEEIPF